MGFVISKSDNSLFIFRHRNDVAYLLLYVDDIVLVTSSDLLRERIISHLRTGFPMTDLGPLNFFLGIAVTRTPSYLFLSQQKYAQEILERAGALQYSTFTRPNIVYAVQQVCLFMHDPREAHYDALKRILRYIQGSINHGLYLYPSSSSQSITYTGANWGGCPDTRLVDLRRQPTLSKSSAEAEYRGVANVVAEACLLRNLLLELHCPLRKATVVYCDNVSSIYLSHNPVQHQRTKHIEMDIHFVREKVALGHVRVLHVPSRYQFADIFTKGLPRQLFLEFRSNLSVRPPPAKTAGV
ncbi:uncharacterized protein LOC110737459 [Chenopodium quinoa]|uniref:uncharacterized protein LOC110737459 n=1 Tax=Chenopodium quinoa TaxID=63459 RepID=UPI000B77A1AF|nr:uncharacterized protein LOC110737459 [Chenopodium quinoa]